MVLISAPQRILHNLLEDTEKQLVVKKNCQGADFLQKYFQGRRRLSSFERDYPALLVVLSSMIKAGGDPFVCLIECRNLFSDESEIHFQLNRIADAIHQGETERSAIEKFGNDLDFSEVSLLREVLLLGRQEGASLGQALIRLARVTRQRQSFHRKARAALALQRLSSLGMLLCALCIVVMQFFANPEAFWRAVNHPVGSIFLCSGACAVLVGVIWMLSLSRRRIGVW